MATLQSKKDGVKAKVEKPQDNSAAEIAQLRSEVAALAKRCANLEAKLNKAPAAAPTASGDFVSLHSFKSWQKKVAKKLGIRL